MQTMNDPDKLIEVAAAEGARRKADLEARLEQENEWRRLSLIESYTRGNQRTAELLLKVEAMGWPRIHIPGTYRSSSGRWVKGAEAWRKELAQIEMPAKYLQKGTWVSEEWRGIYPQDAEQAITEYELKHERRNEMAILAPNSADGLAFTQKAFDRAKFLSEKEDKVTARGFVETLGNELGLRYAGPTPTGRVKHFIDAALSAGVIEPCTYTYKHGEETPGYRRVAEPTGEKNV